MPFAVELADRFLCDDKPEELAAKTAARHLNECYKNLSRDVYNPDTMADNARKFCLLQVGLEQFHPDTKLWRVKPKLHLFQHMAESKSCPSSSWNYRDEDFGGGLSRMSRRRGGKDSPWATSSRVLIAFVAKHTLPRF
jgi:hypothetical protein